jgi:hypothetical protein
MTAPLLSRRWLAASVAVVLLVALTGAAMIAGSPRVGIDSSARSGVSIAALPSTSVAAPASVVSAGPTALPTAAAAADPTFQPIDLFAVQPPEFQNPTPAPSVSDAPGDAIYGFDGGRQTPSQSMDWLTLKAAGRIVLSNGQVGVLPAGADPLTSPTTGQPVPALRTLDLSWTRWIVEPPGSGVDAKGNNYANLSYWNLCGPGSAAVTLYYWEKLAGGPNVTATSGYYLDPYLAAGSTWPVPGPRLPMSGGKVVGTYWAGSDIVSGFTAHARGYLMYLAMQVTPAGWTTPGVDIMVDGEGKPRYPLLGATMSDIEAALNWEASKHRVADSQDFYYASVGRWDPTLARDLQAAVMLDVGRDGVPVVAGVDTFGLPNWQASDPSKTPHTRHAIAIVGYDNTANPPTYTYLDTCGRSCNNRGGNQNGQIHVISQDGLVQSLTAAHGLSFVW